MLFFFFQAEDGIRAVAVTGVQPCALPIYSVEVAKKTLDDAKARVEAGTRNRVEVTRAELALVRAEQAQLEAVDTRQRAYRNLATLLRIKEEFQVQAPELSTAAPPEASDLARDA